MTEPLPILLDHYYYNTLVQIAASNGLVSAHAAGQRPRKDVLIKLLCERVYVPDAARAALVQLTALQRTVLDRIVLHGGEVETHLLGKELENEGIVPRRQTDGRIRPRGPNRQWSHLSGDSRHPADDSRGTSFEDVVAELTRRGLVLSNGYPQSWNPGAKLDLKPGLRLLVPEAVRKGLPQPALPSVEWGSPTLPAPPAETTTALAQRDLFIYWSHARRQPIPVTQLGLVQKRTLRALNEQLLLPDPALATASNEQETPRLHFLRLLLQGLQLLQLRGKWITAETNSQASQFWSKSLQQRTNACLRVWTRLTDWSELSSLGMSSFYLDLQRARGVLLEHLRRLEPSVWFSADRFLGRLSIAVPDLLFQSGNAHTAAPYYYDQGYRGQHGAAPPSRRWQGAAAGSGSEGGIAASGAFPSLAQRPSSSQPGSQWLAEIGAAFVGGALSGPLHWLGIVDIAADGSRLLAFRLNSGGALAFGLRDSGSQPALEEAKLVVQPNFQIFALGPVSEATLAQLESFADRVKTDRSAFEYTLSHAAIYRGQKAGLSIDQIIAFLEKESSAALPQNVLRTLQEYGEQHERIVFRRAVALGEARSPEMMTDLWNEPTAKSHLQQRLTPTVALLKKGRVHALREALLQRGFLPAISAQTDHCAGRLQATPDGDLTPVHEGPDLLLESCLQSLAEQQEGRFRITEAAVQRAAAVGITVKEYLKQLNALHHGPVPAALQMRIKAWGRYYGKASLQKAVLLEVKDSATADDLMEDAELAPLLSRFAADPRGRLLLVHARDLERLRGLLEERGVEVVTQP
jgi:hypothetical protein